MWKKGGAFGYAQVTLTFFGKQFEIHTYVGSRTVRMVLAALSSMQCTPVDRIQYMQRAERISVSFCPLVLVAATTLWQLWNIGNKQVTPEGKGRGEDVSLVARTVSALVVHSKLAIVVYG